MSCVSGVVLMMSVCESDGEDEVGDSLAPKQLAEINGWLARNDKLPLVEVTDHLPRGKHPQVLVYGGGYNYLDEDGFAQIVLAQAWGRPDNVVLLINPEDGPTRVSRPAENT